MAERSCPLPARVGLQQDLDLPGAVLGHGRAGTAAARPGGGPGGTRGAMSPRAGASTRRGQTSATQLPPFCAGWRAAL